MKIYEQVKVLKKEKVTIYYSSEFFGSIQSIEGYLIEHGTRKYAQYEKAPFVKYIPKGKRKVRIMQKSYNPYLLIVKNWDNPKSEGMFKQGKINNEITIMESKYNNYDDRYKTDFNKVINEYKENFIADYRQIKEG